MSFVKVLGFIGVNNKTKEWSQFYDYDHTEYMPLPTSRSVKLVNGTYELFHILRQPNEGILRQICWQFHGVLATLFNSPLCEWDDDDDKICSFSCWKEKSKLPLCPIEKALGSFYVFPYVPDPNIDDLIVADSFYSSDFEATLFWCIVHPDERERMERILAGTDNPIHDLVHELRYNPNITTQLGGERREAKEDLEQGGEGVGANKKHKKDE